MIDEQDDIQIVMLSKEEFEMRCTACGALIRHPNNWWRHRKSLKHKQAEMLKSHIFAVKADESNRIESNLLIFDNNKKRQNLQ